MWQPPARAELLIALPRSRPAARAPPAHPAARPPCLPHRPPAQQQQARPAVRALDPVLLELVVLAPVADARGVAERGAAAHLLRGVEVGEVVHLGRVCRRAAPRPRPDIRCNWQPPDRLRAQNSIDRRPLAMDLAIGSLPDHWTQKGGCDDSWCGGCAYRPWGDAQAARRTLVGE